MLHGKAEAIYSWQIANIAKGKFNGISVISGGNMWFTGLRWHILFEAPDKERFSVHDN